MRRAGMPVILSLVFIALAAAASIRPPWTMAELAAFVPVAGGTFRMGDTFGDSEAGGAEFPVHQVTVSPFRMMKCEVSWALWTTVRQWALTNGYELGDGQAGAGEVHGSFRGFHPVTEVEWIDCVKWCNAWSEKSKLAPVYFTAADRHMVLRKGEPVLSSACVRWDADGYRLPTEAEWEYTAREGGRNVRFGDGTDIATHYRILFACGAVFKKPYSAVGRWWNATEIVGQRVANALGLHDMSGNAWEWCWDGYGPYAAGAQVDPRGPDGKETRVVRGGGYNSRPEYVRAAAHEGTVVAGMSAGFRVVRGGYVDR